MLNTHGMTRYEILMALYNRSQPLGLGFLRARRELTIEEAKRLADEHDYFDYLHGRVMKISLSQLDPRLYDRDNGPGAAQAALDEFFTDPDRGAP